MNDRLVQLQEPMGLALARNEVSALLRSMPVDARIADPAAHIQAFAEEVQHYPIGVWREALSPMRRNKTGVAPSIATACAECEAVIMRREAQLRAEFAAQVAAETADRSIACVSPIQALAERRRQEKEAAERRRSIPSELASRAILCCFGRAEWQEWSRGFRTKEPRALAIVDFMAVVFKADQLLRRGGVKLWCAIINAATVDPAEADALLCASPAAPRDATDADPADIAAARASIVDRYSSIMGRAVETGMQPHPSDALSSEKPPETQLPMNVGRMRLVAEEAARIAAAVRAQHQGEDPHENDRLAAGADG
jgi:hypothetical protein